ncbi:MAG TPA: esterase, partial [Thermoplasmata archaeon]|nr:esterase [Thermoplasmata archaeon]
MPGAPPDAVIYAADGQGTASWGATVDRADLASTLIVGVHAAPDETERLHEYSLGLAPAQF